MARPAQPAEPQKRDGMWYLVRWVPKAYQHLDTRKVVRLSTEIRVADDPRGIRATPAVRQLDRELKAYWRGLADGQAGEAKKRFDEAQRRARSLHLEYLTAGELAEGPLDEILKRVQLLIDRNAAEDEKEVAAIMGGEARPSLKLSNLYDEFEGLMAPTLTGHSPNQIKKWGQKYKRAVKAFQEVLGEDKALVKLTRADGIKLRKHWQERITGEGIDIGTANKSMGHIGAMLNQVELAHQLGIPPIFEKLAIPGAKKRQRPPYTVDFVRTLLLANGALDGLNAEARAVVWVCAELGMRPVEVCNLMPDTIMLRSQIPHLKVRPVGRVLKTDQSERDIPLVGAALIAMKHFPAGFPRYHDNGDLLSNVVNKFFEDNHLTQTIERPGIGERSTALYSLRHTFEDRLTAVDAPEKMIAALMGHKGFREKYGEGPTLAHKLEWLQKIAFSPVPEHFGPLG